MAFSWSNQTTCGISHVPSAGEGIYTGERVMAADRLAVFAGTPSLVARYATGWAVGLLVERRPFGTA